MDKNMINIDDLFRQRLGGAEEKDRPAAWLRMSELLDEKMPVDSGSNWRRLFGYTAGLLLLATATFGGYEAIHAFRGHSEGNSVATAANIPATPHATIITPNTSAGNSIVSDNKLNDNQLNSVNSSVTKEEKGAIPTKHISKHTSNIAFANNNTEAHKNAPAPIVKEASAIAATDKRETGNVEEKTLAASNTPKQTAASEHSIKPVHHSAKIAKAIVTTAQVTIVPASATATVKSINKKPALAKITTVKNNTLAANTNSKGTKSSKTANTNSITPAAAPTANASMPVTMQTMVKNEEMLKLNVRQIITVNPRNNTALVHFDTISKDKFLVTTNMANDAQSPLLASNSPSDKIIPGASSVSSSEMKAAENANKNGGGNKSHLKNNAWDMDHFRTMIDNFKYNFKHIELVPGVTAGINATFFGNFGLKGFQMGLTENIEMNDHWSLLTELKYFNRFGNITINDDYTFYDNPSGNQWLKHVVPNTYNFSTIQSLELPVVLRYNYKHFIISGGANVVYNFAVNTNFVNPAYIPTYNVSEPGANTEAKLSGNSFSSRWGLGCAFGVGYELMQGMELDLRMTQTFMDNTNTAGARIISNDLYNTPSLQLSIGYHLVREHKMIRR